MKSFLVRDIPPRAAGAIVALVLLATLVTGRERDPAPLPGADRSGNPPGVTAPQPADDLDLEKLARRETASHIRELFAAPASPAPAAAPPPPPAVVPTVIQPPPAPPPPPLPYRYLGRMAKRGKTVVYLLNKESLLLAEAGEVLEGTYRVDSISTSVIKFTHLPTGVERTLALSTTP